MCSQFSTKEPRICNQKGTPSFINGVGNAWYLHAKNETEPLSHINSKWIKDGNIRPELIKLLEDNMGDKLLDLGLGNGFLGLISSAGNKSKNKKVGLLQKKELLYSKENHE